PAPESLGGGVSGAAASGVGEGEPSESSDEHAPTTNSPPDSTRTTMLRFMDEAYSRDPDRAAGKGIPSGCGPARHLVDSEGAHVTSRGTDRARSNIAKSGSAGPRQRAPRLHRGFADDDARAARP